MRESSAAEFINQRVKRGLTEIFSEVVTLTPEIAAELLRRNDNNRSLRATKITQYAADIASGAWTLNGEPIIIAKTGELNDGQHRCLAVVEANRPMSVVMMFGLPRESRTTIDQGAQRSAADYASMDGVPNAAVAAALARMVEAYERSDFKNLTATKFVTNADVQTRIECDPAIAEAASFAAGQARFIRRYAAPAVVGFYYYAFRAIDSADAEKFMHQVCRGEGLKARDPAWAVRHRLLNAGKLSRPHNAHIIFRGWNAFRQGRPMVLAKIVGDDLPVLL